MPPLAAIAFSLSRPIASSGSKRRSSSTASAFSKRKCSLSAPHIAPVRRGDEKCTTRTSSPLAVAFDVGGGGGSSSGGGDRGGRPSPPLRGQQQQQQQQQQKEQEETLSIPPLDARHLEQQHHHYLEAGKQEGEREEEEEEATAAPPPLPLPLPLPPTPTPTTLPPPPPPPRLTLPLAAFALEAALWPELLLSWASRKKTELEAYLALSRPWNLLPSMLMVFCGAAAATARLGGATTTTTAAATMTTTAAATKPLLLLLPLSLLSNAKIWHAALSTAAIALGSMVVNDYFDVAGDRINSPGKPLPSGLVPVDGALLFGGFLYLSTLVAAAWLEPRELRLLVACSAAVTLAYTPLLKKVPVAKTAAVAGVVSLSPLAGALAAAGGTASSSCELALSAVAPACLLAFFAVSGRELLMDAADARGDGAAGVPTLPLLVGRRATLALAAALEACAAAVLLSRVFSASRASCPSFASAPSALLVVVAAASLWLGTRLVAPAAAAARAAVQAAALRKKKEKKKKNDDVSLRELSEAEARVSSAIKAAVDGMMMPAGAAVIAALLLG